MNKESFGTRLYRVYRLLKSKKIIKNIDFLAEQWGVSRTMVNNYFKNVPPGGDVLAKINQFGIDMNWLLEGTGSMFADNEAGRKLKERIGVSKVDSPINSDKFTLEESLAAQEDLIRHINKLLDGQ